MTNSSSTTELGNAFELTVAQHYESLGYRVARSQNINGHQIDLVASRDVAGAGVVNVMIEAKFRSEGIVGINDVINSVNAAVGLLSGQKISNAVIVTNTRFSDDAQRAVEAKPNIRLVTLHDLQQEIFNSSESLLRSVQDFSTSETAHEYIALSAASYSGHKQESDIARHLHYHAAKGGHLTVLLGDFGSGKTTVLRKVFVQCANDRLSAASSRFPIFLSLQSLRQHKDLWSFVSSNLSDHQYIRPPKSVFDKMLNDGRLIVFLDGFDEIYAGATLKDRGQYLAMLLPLLNSYSPCILSSRPTYFSTPLEMLSALRARLSKGLTVSRTRGDAKTRSALSKMHKSMGLQGAPPVSANLFDDVWTIQELSENAILEYLTKQESTLRGRTGKSARQIRDVVGSIYDLSDLMRRPLLLKMVVEAIVSNLIDINAKQLAIGPSTLYEAYTAFSFERDTLKRGVGTLSGDARRVVCQYLAIDMAKRGSAELSGDEVRKCIVAGGVNASDMSMDANSVAFGKPGNAHILDEVGVESILTDARLASFLTFGRDGTLRFAHKSYMEFFVAQFIREAALSSPDALSRVGELPLNREVIYFLGSYARDNPEFGKWVLRRLTMDTRRSAFSKEAALRTAFASGDVLSNSTIEEAQISDAELVRATVANAALRKVLLKAVSISHLSATAWTVSSTVVERSKFANARFLDSNIDLDAESSAFSVLSIEQGSFGLHGSRWTLDDSSFQNADVRFTGSGLLHNVRLEQCRVELSVRATSGHRLQAEHCVFKGSVESGAWVLGENISLRDSLVCGIVVSMGELLSNVTATSTHRRKSIDTLSTNRGVAFVDTIAASQAAISQWEGVKASLPSTFGKLYFFDLQKIQNVFQMQKGRRAAALRLIRKTERKTGKVVAQSLRGDVESVLEASSMAEVIKANNWSTDAAFETLISQLKGVELL